MLLLGRGLRLMLLRLLLELLLILRRDRRHRGGARDTLRPGATPETRVLVLQRHRGLLLLLLLRYTGRLRLHGESGVLLLERSLPEASRLRSERTRLLLSSTRLGWVGSEGAPILLLARPLGIAA